VLLRVRMLPLLSLLACALIAGAADEKKDAPKEKGTALDAFKNLAGEWVGKGGDAKDSHEAKVTYKVTSNGSAVVETIDPGGNHEMVTMIHLDGDKVVLTHYCALGNQPRMKAPAKLDGKKVAFEFADATNLKSDRDMHMHNVTYTFVDEDTIKTEWTHYMDGKAAGTMVFELKRKK
jgi:hypothetical protein